MKELIYNTNKLNGYKMFTTLYKTLYLFLMLFFLNRLQLLCGGTLCQRGLNIWTQCFSSFVRSSTMSAFCTFITTAPCSLCGGLVSNGLQVDSVSIWYSHDS